MYGICSSLRYGKHALTRAFHLNINPSVIEIANKLEDTKNALMEAYSPRREEALDKSFKMCAYHTLKLEMVPVTENEIQRQREATEYVQNSFEVLKTEQIQRVNRIIMNGRSINKTEYRNAEACVRQSSGELFYFPPCNHVSQLMIGLVEYMNSLNLELHHILRAAFLKTMILSIHPFSDGNGRSSRVIFNGLLRQRDYLYVTIPVSESEKYFSALQSFENTRDLEPIIFYLFHCIERSLKIYQECILE